jgi:ABC-type dipeptide/oligopeptide/nickel transport system ATPase component
MAEPILSVRDLKTYFLADEGVVRAVDGTSFDLFPARRWASSANPAAARASPRVPSCASSSVPAASSAARSCCAARWWRGGSRDAAVRRRAMRQIRGGEIGLVFQEPMSSLSAFHTIGNQLIEAIRLHCATVQAARGRVRSSCWRWSAFPARRSGRCVFVRIVRRPAPAGDDRPGAGGRAARADRR